MRRILEIIREVRALHPKDSFFCNFHESCRIPPKGTYYRAYNNALMWLDHESWQILKEKALKHYLGQREGQTKQDFFNQLNEAFAYRYLARMGLKKVRFVRERRTKSPDISFLNHQATQSYCEVKTLGISDDEIARRRSQKCYDLSVYLQLSDGFLRKFCGAVDAARQQICAFGSQGLVYIIIRFDDLTLDNYRNYRRQLVAFCQKKGFDNLFIRIGLLGNRRICVRSRFAGHHDGT